MRDYTELTPAYDRDYKRRADVLADWNAGKDFIIQDFGNLWDGKPCNKEDAAKAGARTVLLRYDRLTKVTAVKVK
jgi:hypothetical protein